MSPVNNAGHASRNRVGLDQAADEQLMAKAQKKALKAQKRADKLENKAVKNREKASSGTAAALSAPQRKCTIM